MTSVMDRRTFLAGTGAVLLAGPLAAEGQTAGKVWRIGWLGVTPPSSLDAGWEAFIAGLRERGYVEGQNIVLERRYSEGREDRFPGFAAELVQMKVDVIVVASTQAARAAKAATSSIPIVLVGILDPERTGLVASLGRPGGNVTGISNSIFELQPKQLHLFKEAVPRLSRIAVMWNPANDSSALAWRETQDPARTLGMTTISGSIASPAELEPALAAVAAQRPDGLYVHLIMAPYRKRIIEFALIQRLPTFVSDRRWADAGALLTYGPSSPDMLRRSAGYVDKILKGAKPADLPVEQPNKFDFVINLKTAKALGLTIPPSLLGRADEVIQ
jgi:putative ABC transport system substrate-binding protein